MDFSSVNLKTIALFGKLNGYFNGHGTESFLVGGFVRDLLLGRDTADIDIAVKGDARESASEIADLLGGRYVLLDDANKVARVILFDGKEESPGISYEIDFSSFTGTIREDMARRDFTVNAMAIGLNELATGNTGPEIIDPFNGRSDLEKGVVRAVGDNVFYDDPARLLRAVRLAGELGLAIVPETENLIKQYAVLAADVPGERTREELLRLSALPGAGKNMKYLDSLNLLTAIFPELEESRGLEQPREHHWNVLDHSLAAVESLEFVCGDGEWEYAGAPVMGNIPHPDEIIEHLSTEVSSGSSRKTLLRLAALLHDTGKPATRAVDETGRTRFIGHSKEGASLVKGMLEKLRFSNREIRIIETEVLHHMRPTQLSPEGMPSNRAVYRYYRDTGPTGIDILFLNLADHLATKGPGLDEEKWVEHIELVSYLIEKYYEKENIVNPPKIIDGYDIIKTFGVGPGPRIGELLDAVHEAQASGDVTDKAAALEFIGKLLD